MAIGDKIKVLMETDVNCPNGVPALDETGKLKDDLIDKIPVDKIDNFPEALPASDVPEWAKAATKPTYTASEVGADPAGTAANAIAALDVTDTAVSGKYVSSVSETDGKITVTREDLPDYSNTYDAKGAADDALASSKSYADTKASATLDSAKGYTDELANGAVADNSEAIAAINDTSTGILAQAKSYADTKDTATLDSAKSYTDAKIDAIMGEGASDTLNSIGEISTAIEDNQDALELLNAAVGKKANASDLTDHTGNTSNPHGVTKAQVGLGNVENKSSATIRGELTKQNVTDALGYTPSESDTVYTHPTSHPASMITGLATVATSGSYNDLSNKPTSLPANGGNSATVNGLTVQTAVPANAKFTDTTYGAAGSALGLVKSGGDVTISDGVITVNDDSHAHVISNVDGLQAALDGKSPTSHTHSSYANQNAFSNIKVGDTTIAADTTTDTVTLVGSNVTITPDATNDKVTIAITKDNVTGALGYTPPTTNTTYSNFVKSGSGAKAGLVPAPSTTAGTTKYLREDGTWAVPPDTNTTYTLGSFGITATAAELNKLDGVTATAAEINYVDGVTSNIQTQLNAKQGKHTTLTLTLAVASWSNLAQTITASGVTASNTVVVSPAPASYEAYNKAGVRCTAQAANSLTFACDTVPTVALTVNVIIL